LDGCDGWLPIEPFFNHQHSLKLFSQLPQKSDLSETVLLGMEIKTRFLSLTIFPFD
jgi:hypothetical protein